MTPRDVAMFLSESIMPGETGVDDSIVGCKYCGAAFDLKVWQGWVATHPKSGLDPNIPVCQTCRKTSRTPEKSHTIYLGGTQPKTINVDQTYPEIPGGDDVEGY